MSIKTNQAFRTDRRRWNNNLFEQADHLPSADRVIPDLPLAERLLSIDIIGIQAYRVRRRQHRPRIPESLNHTMNEYHQDDSTGSIPTTPSIVTRYIAQNGYPDYDARTNDTKGLEAKHPRSTRNKPIISTFIPYMIQPTQRPHKHQMHQPPSQAVNLRLDSRNVCTSTHNALPALSADWDIWNCL